MGKLKDAARKSGMFIVSDSDLDFNQPVVRVKIDRSKANDLGITMQQIGNTLATLLGGNYINRFNLEGRSYQVIPQVPRELAAVAGSARRILRADATGQQVPLSTVVSIETGDRSQRADALQPAQLGDLLGGADARRDRRPGGRLPASRQAKNLPSGLQPRLSRATPGNMCRRATSSRSPSASR